MPIESYEAFVEEGERITQKFRGMINVITNLTDGPEDPVPQGPLDQAFGADQKFDWAQASEGERTAHGAAGSFRAAITAAEDLQPEKALKHIRDARDSLFHESVRATFRDHRMKRHWWRLIDELAMMDDFLESTIPALEREQAD
ncbi:MAG: hypothetical protein KC619_04440 [Myxococcales bacterium]|nr:hypothetical protein [Myxococcales bacterium]